MDLVKKARLDPDSALGDLLERYRSYLTVLARGSLPPEVGAKAGSSDAVQETMLRACRHFDQFRGETEAELAAWLRKILAHTLADIARRYQGAKARDVYRERRLEQSLNDSSAALGEVVAASGTGPVTSAGRQELGLAVARALDRLSEDHREVLVLRHLEGLDWGDVAERMGRSRKAVGMLWARALRSIRPHLEERRG